MTKSLYLRLACANLWKNRSSYFPFLFASIMLTFTIYSFASMALNRGLAHMAGTMVMTMMLALGLVIVSFFAAIFLFYANSFLIKRRKKELGLYSILGMEKKHIAKVLRWELNLSWLITMAVGLGLGFLLSRLLYLLVQWILKVPVPLENAINPYALLGTAALFAGLFFLLKLYNSYQVRAVSPLALLRGGQMGEKEPTSRWPLAVVGLITLLSGYLLAQWVNNPMTAITMFFFAVLLVIIGTYCLFMAGSLTVLKLLKNNHRFYYQPRHFITVSGMLYRMKQNAAGLASIAILCTMAMVTVGTTVAMYSGTERTINRLYPNDLSIQCESPQAADQVRDTLDTTAHETGMTLHDLRSFSAHLASLGMDGTSLRSGPELSERGLRDFNQLFDACILTQGTFSSLQGQPLVLGEHRLGWWSPNYEAPATVSIGGIVYTFEMLPAPDFQLSLDIFSSSDPVLMVAPDETAIAQLSKELGLENTDYIHKINVVQANLGDTPPEQEAYVDLLQARLSSDSSARLTYKAALRTDVNTLYGGFLFVGLFLGLLFLMATGMIIYFKQISEGYQDHDRFIILQQVGMSQQEVKQTVQTQILIVFFLPLAVAICHVAGSLHMMILMLQGLSLSEAPFVAFNAFVTAAVIAALYAFFYLRTAKTYYKMVRF